MNNLKLPNPNLMDVAVPANLRIGLAQDELDEPGFALSCEEAIDLIGSEDVMLVDIREKAECQRHGVILGAIHAPYGTLEENVRPGGMLHELAMATGKRVIFYCAYGERSVMAVETARDAGLADACHIQGGLDGWKKANGPTSA